MGEVETHHGMKVPKGQESEEFDVAFQTHLEEKAPEWKNTCILTDLVVEEAVENAIEDEEYENREGYWHDKVLSGASKEEVIYAFDFNVLLVWVGVVVGVNGSNIFLNKREIFWVDDLWLFWLDKPDGSEDVVSEKGVVLFVIFIQPKVINSIK